MKNNNRGILIHKFDNNRGIFLSVISSLALHQENVASIVSQNVAPLSNGFDVGGTALGNNGADISITSSLWLVPFGNNKVKIQAYGNAVTKVVGSSTAADFNPASGAGTVVSVGDGLNYVGIKFDGLGGINYGWLELNLSGGKVQSAKIYYNSVDNQGVKLVNGNISAVPEPATIGALAAGAAAVVALRRRRKQKKTREVS